jgi:hypothetical protein
VQNFVVIKLISFEIKCAVGTAQHSCYTFILCTLCEDCPIMLPCRSGSWIIILVPVLLLLVMVQKCFNKALVYVMVMSAVTHAVWEVFGSSLDMCYPD